MIKILNGIHETVDYNLFSSIKIYLNREAEDYPLHWHPAAEIIMPLKNNYTVVINDISYTLDEGDIFIIPPGTLHHLISPPPHLGGERLIILFDYGLICNINGTDALLSTLQPYTLIRCDEYPELNGMLRSLLEEVYHEYTHQTTFTEALIYSLMIRFFVTIGRASFDTGKNDSDSISDKQHEYIEKFMTVSSYINDHCTENISVDTLADIAGFSRFHFSRLFKQFYGVSCHEYLIRKRIDYVEMLLIRPDISITEAAMRSGFGSISSFNRVFKEIKRCTPSEYKALNRKNN